jgi:hypothetical protein
MPQGEPGEWMMRKFSLGVLIALGVVAAPFPARAASVIATTGLDVVNNGTENGTPTTNGFSVPSGTFLTYTPSPGDPELTGNDLADYRYDLEGAGTSVTAATIDYTGTYNIYYSLSGHTEATDPSVSSGTFDILAKFFTANSANLTGILTQTSGPSNPAFANLATAYGNPVDYIGTYVGGTVDTSHGTIQGELLSAAPLPKSAFAGLALFGILGVWRVRSRTKLA